MHLSSSLLVVIMVANSQNTIRMNKYSQKFLLREVFKFLVDRKRAPRSVGKELKGAIYSTSFWTHLSDNWCCDSSYHWGAQWSVEILLWLERWTFRLVLRSFVEHSLIRLAVSVIKLEPTWKPETSWWYSKLYMATVHFEPWKSWDVNLVPNG